MNFEQHLHTCLNKKKDMQSDMSLFHTLVGSIRKTGDRLVAVCIKRKRREERERERERENLCENGRDSEAFIAPAAVEEAPFTQLLHTHTRTL